MLIRVSLKPAQYMGGYTVHLDANTLRCDVRTVPYPFCAGAVGPFVEGPVNRVGITRKQRAQNFIVWTPAGYTPRGYVRAATALLSAVVAAGLTEGEHGVEV